MIFVVAIFVYFFSSRRGLNPSTIGKANTVSSVKLCNAVTACWNCQRPQSCNIITALNYSGRFLSKKSMFIWKHFLTFSSFRKHFCLHLRSFIIFEASTTNHCPLVAKTLLWKRISFPKTFFQLNFYLWRWLILNY